IGGLSRFCSGVAQTGGPPVRGDLLGGPDPAWHGGAHLRPVLGPPHFLSPPLAFAVDRLINAHALKFAFVVGPVYGLGVWFGASLFGKASEAVFRAICYVLIAAAVIIGLPALDGVLLR